MEIIGDGIKHDLTDTAFCMLDEWGQTYSENYFPSGQTSFAFNLAARKHSGGASDKKELHSDQYNRFKFVVYCSYFHHQTELNKLRKHIEIIRKEVAEIKPRIRETLNLSRCADSSNTNKICIYIYM